MYFFIKLGRDVNHGERIDPIDFGGQRSRSQWARFLIKLGRHVNHGKPIDYGGHSSKVKVTMGIIDKCGVRRDATLCVIIFSNGVHLPYIYIKY